MITNKRNSTAAAENESTGKMSVHWTKVLRAASSTGSVKKKTARIYSHKNNNMVNSVTKLNSARAPLAVPLRSSRQKLKSKDGSKINLTRKN